MTATSQWTCCTVPEAPLAAGMSGWPMLTELAAVRAHLAAERPEGERDDVHFTKAVAESVVGAFSKPGEWVLDPFAGFGTTLLAAEKLGRHSIGLELLEQRARLVRRRLHSGHIVVADARQVGRLLKQSVDLCFTSPPYMTAEGHPQNPLTGYTTLDGEYQTYLNELEDVFRQVANLLRRGGYLVINVADTGAAGRTPLVADVELRVAQHLHFERRMTVLWDDPPPGLPNDTCLVYRRP